MNNKKYMESKKTRHMLITQVIIVVIVIAVLAITKGDPEKTQSLLSAVMPYILPIAGLGGVAIGGQALVDASEARRDSKKK